MEAGADIVNKKAVAKDKLELVFQDDNYQLTGVAVSKSGRMFTNYPLWQGPHKFSLVEITSIDESVPYPNLEMNTWKEGEDGKSKWVCVQAVYIDEQDVLWVVDPACPRMEKVYQNSHKLVKISLDTNEVLRTFFFEGVTGEKSYINDVRIDNERGVAYLTNSNEGGIIVLDLNSGKSRQLLTDHYSVHSDPEFKFIIDGHELMKEGKPAKMQSDGIALTKDGEWLYYKPLTDDKLYRIRTEFLRDESIDTVQVGEWVEDLGSFNTTDGMIFGPKGILYQGDLQTSEIVTIDKEHKKTILLQDDRLIWPDSYAVSEDGYLYVTCSQIHKQPEYNEGENKRETPYTIYRIRLEN